MITIDNDIYNYYKDPQARSQTQHSATVLLLRLDYLGTTRLSTTSPSPSHPGWRCNHSAGWLSALNAGTLPGRIKRRTQCALVYVMRVCFAKLLFSNHKPLLRSLGKKRLCGPLSSQTKETGKGAPGKLAFNIPALTDSRVMCLFGPTPTLIK